MKSSFGIETTIIPLLREDGRAHFAYPKSTGARVLEWTVGTLWVLAVALAVGVFWF